MPRRISPIRQLYADAAAGRPPEAATAAPEAPAQLAEGKERQEPLDPAQELWLSSRIGGLMRSMYGTRWHQNPRLGDRAKRIAEDLLNGRGESFQKLSTNARRYSRNSQSILIALAAKHGD